MQIANPSATGWRVYAKPGCLDLWFNSGKGMIRVRVTKGKLTRHDVQALKAIQQPVLVAGIPRRSRVTAPRRHRGRDNQGKNRTDFILRLGGRPPVEMRVVGQSLIGTGLLKALQHRINRRQTGPVPRPPVFLKESSNEERPEVEHRPEEVFADPEEPGPRQVQGLDQPGQLHAALELDQEPLGA